MHLGGLLRGLGGGVSKSMRSISSSWSYECISDSSYMSGSSSISSCMFHGSLGPLS